MESGKRASMREGPLAALFRKTDEEGASKAEVRAEPTPEPEAREARPNPREAAPPAASSPEPPEFTLPPREAATPPREAEAPAQESASPEPPAPEPPAPDAAAPPRESSSRYDGVPSAPERLATVFSSDIPENIMDRPEPTEAAEPPRVEREPIKQPVSPITHDPV